MTLGTSLTNYGYNFIKKVELSIGNKLIDSHTSNWLETYAELTQPNEFGSFASASNALFMNSVSAPQSPLCYATRFQSMCMAGGVEDFSDEYSIPAKGSTPDPGSYL